MERVLGEEWLSQSVDLLVRLVETAGALIIFFGAMSALALVGYAALACVAAGVLAGVLVLAVTRDGRLALRVALDLWLAAGLLRLAQPPAWDQLLSAAAIIAVRQLVGLGLRADPERAGPRPLSPSGPASLAGHQVWRPLPSDTGPSEAPWKGSGWTCGRLLGRSAWSGRRIARCAGRPWLGCCVPRTRSRSASCIWPRRSASSWWAGCWRW